MDDTAISFFDNQDTQMMSTTIQNALNRTPDGKKSSWKNSSTGAWGYAIPSNTSKRNGTICRKLTLFNEAQNRSGVSTYLFCKIKGEWKIPSQ